MHRQELLSFLDNYQTRFMEEAAMLEKMRRFVVGHDNCFDRSLATGHVSGSAWVVNPGRTHVLLMHHKKLGLWLQPGGHADGDTDIHNVVLKETAEESGLHPDNIILVSDQIFDIDVHTIHETEHEARHTHYDVRFLVEIDDALPVPGNGESFQIGWVPLQEVSVFNNALSFHRLAKKTRMLVSA